MASVWDRIRGKSSGLTETSDRKSSYRAPMLINLGIDFGTSFTKVCYRDAALDSAGIVDFSDGETMWEASLISSKIAVGDDGSLVAGVSDEEWIQHVSKEYRVISYPKVRLSLLDRIIEMHDFDLPPIPGFEKEEDLEVFIAAFLANVLMRSRAWVLEHRSAEMRGREIIWSANVGVPVKVYDSPAIMRFQRVLKIASLIADEHAAKITTVKDARELYGRFSQLELPVDVHAVPEIAAAAQSFLSSPTAEEGLYLFFDIGGATLDGVSFRYLRVQGRPQVNFFGAEIAILGVDAIVARHAKYGSDAIREGLFLDLPSGLLVSELEGERTYVMNMVAKVLMDAHDKDLRNWMLEQQFPDGHILTNLGIANANRRELVIFLGGGGQSAPFYSHVFEDTRAERFNNYNVPDWLIANVPVPDNLDMADVPDEHFHRFAVAYGLSVPDGQGPRFTLPSENVPQPIKTKTVTPLGIYEN